MKKKIIYITLFVVACFIACKKGPIVADISDKSITVNAPANNLKTPTNKITFWWELLEGADKYNIQVVKPSFANVAELIADSNVTGNKFNLSFVPGTYQWRIKAINTGYSTGFQTFSFTIDSSDILTNQDVVPIGPAGIVTGNKVVTFSWSPIQAATSYSIEISMGSVVVNRSEVTSSSYTYTFSASTASNYPCSWRVKALNGISISQYNTPQTFTIDLLPPTVSTPTAPTNNSLVRDTFELRWNKSASADFDYDSLFVYNDSTLLSLVQTATLNVTKVKIMDIDPANPLSAGTSSTAAIPYWWRLKSVDKAGNRSSFSSKLKFQLVQ